MRAQKKLGIRNEELEISVSGKAGQQISAPAALDEKQADIASALTSLFRKIPNSELLISH